MKKLILTLLLTMPSILFAQTPPIEAGVSHELAKWRAARYSDVRYKINLTLEKMSPVLKGTIEIRVRVGAGTLLSPSPQSGEMPPIILDWRKIKNHEEKSTISNATLNGKPAAFSRHSPRGDKSVPAPLEEIDEHLIFRDGVVAGENVIKLDFTSPILTSGSAITRYVDKEDGAEYIYSLFVPSDASTAFPVFDQPDLKARFQLFVHYVPPEWQIVSNAAEAQVIYQSNTDGDPDTTTHWAFEETKPISTYVFAFAAGPWERVSSPHVSKGSVRPNDNVEPSLTVGLQTPETSIYVRKSQAAKFKPHAAEVFRLNREAVKYFEQYFDYKFPFPKYDLVLIPEFPFGGMEHAGATFLRESSIIFPQEPTKNDLVSRATLIFHEAAHQWFGDTVTMRWFDDLWLKEGFATFTAYKAMEKIMPEMNAWKVFYERIKQGAYQTDSTRGTTAIYQPIANLSAAKSAYGNIVYNKAPAFLRQAEFYLGEDKFQTAVRAFLKKHEFGNAGWSDLVDEFTNAQIQSVSNPEFLNSPQYPAWKQSNIDGTKEWARNWVMRPGLPVVRYESQKLNYRDVIGMSYDGVALTQRSNNGFRWRQRTEALSMLSVESQIPTNSVVGVQVDTNSVLVSDRNDRTYVETPPKTFFFFPNYRDYGYGIFLLDEKSRDHVLKNIQNEKDPFLRTMMWGALWDSVREGELDPREYVELVVKNLSSAARKSTTPAATPTTPSAEAAATPPQAGGELRATTPNQGGESDESTIQTLLGRVSTAMTYYMSEPGAVATGLPPTTEQKPVATAPGSDLRVRLENVLIESMQSAPTLGQRITYYRAFRPLRLAGY